MLLAVSVTNARIECGIFDKTGELVMESRVDAVKTRTADEYAVLLDGILRLYHVDPKQVTEGIVASVVPPLTPVMREAMQRCFGITPLEVGPGIKTGLSIHIDDQTQLGADLVANAVAALETGKPPMAILDFGAVTTLAVLDKSGALEGVIIAPGVRMSLDALSAFGSELPDVSVAPPKRLVGKNTQDSMRAGALHGHGAMVDGLIGRVRRQVAPMDLQVVATGEYASVVLPCCEEAIEPIAHLTLQGLYHIHRKNRR